MNVVEQGSVKAVVGDGGLAIVTLNRPSKRNALDKDTIELLGTVFDRLGDDMRVKLAVLTGAGDKSFAAGGDLKALSAIRDLAGARELSRRTREVFDKIRRFPVPVIAALNGDALGGGSELAAACDMRIAAAHARIGFIQGRLAITTAWGGASDLADLVGPSRALSLLCRSDLLCAEEARALGIVDAISAADQTLDDAIKHYCKPMLDKPRHVLAAFKAVIHAKRRHVPRDELEALESSLFAECWVDDAHWKAADKALKGSGG